MPVGVILAFLAYASFSIADALIKATGPSMSVFEIAFFTTSLSIIPAMLTKRGERWRDIYKLRHPRLVHGRHGPKRQHRRRRHEPAARAHCRRHVPLRFRSGEPPH